MKQYLDVLQALVDKYDRGEFKTDRTGTGTVSLFGKQLRFDLRDGKIPLLTTKKIFTKGVVKELLWFISGSTNNKDLEADGVTIWSEWALENGDLGPIYGEQWRNWEKGYPVFQKDGSMIAWATVHIDQLQNAIDLIRMNPTSRRIIVTAWNPSVVPDSSKSPQDNVLEGNQCLPACHAFFQFNCEEISKEQRFLQIPYITRNLDPIIKHIIDNHGLISINSKNESISNVWNDIFTLHKVPKYYLDCQIYVRSNDWFLGAPFNISQYGILTQMIGKLTNTLPRELVYTTGDTHLYLNHINQAREQLSRTPSEVPALLSFVKENYQKIEDFVYEDFIISNYEPQPPIKAVVAV